MVSHRDVATNWLMGIKSKGSRVFCEDGVIYSYGDHFPIAKILGDKVLFNNDRYSSSTTKHQSIVLGKLRSSMKEVISCDTNEIKRAINYPEEPIIITKTVMPNNIDEALEILKHTCKNEGMKIFPNKQIKDIITKKLFLQKL